MIRRYGLFALVVALGLGAGLRDRFDLWVDRTDLPPVLHDTSVEVRARDGRLLRAFAVENGRIRLAVAPDQVDPAFIDMLIAYEDKRFYDHAGVDLRALLRAGGQALWQGEIVSGASTLTMQVARLLENSGTGRWAGKLRQIRLALALERRLGKDRILALYLLHAPYGGPVEGVRAASLAWFGKEPARLDAAEAALLVALPQSPEIRRPDRFPKAAIAARNRVLARVGAPNAPRGAVRTQALPVKMRALPRLAPHLADHARMQDPLMQHHVTTIDASLQSRMETLARRAVYGQPRQVSAAIVVADHHSGEILASVGAPAYGGAGGAQGYVDMTRALRSPGSALKPFVYGLAFDQGLVHPQTVIHDAPVQFDGYAPQNFDGQFRGDVTVRTALHLSLNVPPVMLTRELGPARVMASLRAGGAAPVVPGGQAGLAITLGGVGVTLLDMVQLYAGLAQGGKPVDLVWQQGTAQAGGAQQMMSQTAAWQVGDILASSAPPQGIGLQVGLGPYAGINAQSGQSGQMGRIAYKTGTSYGHRDAVAFGFDGQHVIGVWLGRPDGTPVPGAFGGELAAPILFEAFSRIGPHRRPLPPPPTGTLLSDTADLPVPLQRFRPRDAVFQGGAQPLTLTFPPDGARVRFSAEGVPLKLSKGVLPISVLVNGVPVQAGLRRRETNLMLDGRGFTRIAVIDALGRAAHAEILVD